MRLYRSDMLSPVASQIWFSGLKPASIIMLTFSSVTFWALDILP